MRRQLAASCDIDELEQNLDDPDTDEAFETKDRVLKMNRLFAEWRSGR